MSNKLLNEIKKELEYVYPTAEAYNKSANNLYQLTEDVAVKFAHWKAKEGWVVDYREQATHSYKELFNYFINNVYKP
jgi:hypothetical protein